MNWQPIETAPKGKKIIVCYKNSEGRWRRILATYFERFTVEANEAGDDASEYDEATDEFYYTEGWWEWIDNWEDYGFVAVYNGEPKYWMPLPDPPEEGE